MSKIGYIRVSTEHQETARQERIMENYGVEKIFSEKLSGKNTDRPQTDRPQFKEMLNHLREGDTLYVESISRLSRSVRDLLKTVDILNEKGVALVSSKENFDTSTPQGRFMLSIFGAMSELERGQLLQRQREGIEQAKSRGVYKGRKPLTIDEKQFRAVCELWTSGAITAVEAMKRLNLTSSTFYRRVRQYGIRKPVKEESTRPSQPE